MPRKISRSLIPCLILAYDMHDTRSEGAYDVITPLSVNCQLYTTPLIKMNEFEV